MNARYRILGLIALIGSASLCGRTQTAEPQTKQPAAAGDEAGFELIFDGQTLKGWEGDPKYWRVEQGSLVGEVTPETILKQNTFIIWRGGVTRDFELKVEYRVSARGSSGINYRSVEVPGQRWVMQGYQADIDGQSRNAGGVRHTGQNYEERGRTFLALRGQMVRVEAEKKPGVIASLGDPKELESLDVIRNKDLPSTTGRRSCSFR